MAKLHLSGLYQKSLSSTKNYVMGQFSPRHETADQLSGLMIHLCWYNFD